MVMELPGRPELLHARELGCGVSPRDDMTQELESHGMSERSEDRSALRPGSFELTTRP